ncbi:MAG: phosphoribosyl-AMP cyclohydrolase [Planctomycetes bacterium]|jgi:phosphoribosyl-AMP cyclohydrolase|nr:phosphoribosyl-AMP cyclohydrolase [Planctomycetota bacterium]
MQLLEKINFNAHGLVPVIVYDAADNRPLTLCYMNRDAVKATVATGKVHVFRRSKGRLMMKGETSGHIQEVREIAIDCDGNSLAIKVDQHVAACHAGYKTCYYRKYDGAADEFRVDGEKVFDPDSVYK